MNRELIIFRNLDFDGAVSIRYIGSAHYSLIRYQLLRNGTIVEERESTSTDEVLRFENQPVGTYKAKALLTLADGTTSTLESIEIAITRNNPIPRKAGPADEKSLKGGHRYYDNVEHYFLEIKLQPGSFDQLKNEVSATLPTYLKCRAGLNFSLVYPPDTLKKRGLEHFSDFYRIDGPIPKDQLIPIALELETLDYVIYCSVTPDTTHLQPPESPPRAGPDVLDEIHIIGPGSTTPDFSTLQTYLDDGAGMNVREAWNVSATGYAATVRHLDFGVYRNHEDLGHITVVNSRPETDDCNHGTASTGCVAATSNGFGVTGVAYDCRFYFYDTGDLDRIVRDAKDGDIVGLDIQFVSNGKYLPVIDNKSWWDKIRALNLLGATVIIAAANGGLNLSPAQGVINDYGDSGGMLAGACYHDTGRRAYFSNYGHYTSLINSWGDWSVATTGYSDLQSLPGNDRNYTRSFSGTSSATPLSVGAVAVLQGYATAVHGVVLQGYQVRYILALNGSDQGVQDGIGRRPNVRSFINYLNGQFK